MLNAGDAGTIRAIRALRDLATEKSKPIVLWVGAGASRWCGYRGWEDLARVLHSKFLRTAEIYDKAKATSLIAGKDFPELFRVCKTSNLQLYNSTLVQAFDAPRNTPVYGRFLSIVRELTPIQVITTNVDDALEKGLPGVITVQRSDFERTRDLIQSRTPFVYKAHGTIGSIGTTVFTSDEYSDIVADPYYISVIEHIFSTAIVVFIGYGLGDEYLLQAINRASSGRPIFGSGPHFAVLPERNLTLPSSVSQILYLTENNADHRSSLLVLDIIRAAQTKEAIRIGIVKQAERVDTPTELRSAYYIADFVPPGTWTSSQSIEARRPGHKDVNVVLGLGFTEPEMPSLVSTAMHDLTVGLVCFDLVYLPLTDLVKAHELFGSERFWRLVASDSLRFVYSPNFPSIIFEHTLSYDNGGIGVVHVNTEDGARPRTVAEEIRRFLRPTPGKEAEAENQFVKLEEKVVTFSISSSESLPTLVRGCLINPSVQSSLGLSDAFLPDAIPRWNVFPILRLAHLVSVGQVCQHFGIPATRVGFGGAALIGPAFGAAAVGDWADEAASYVLNQRFNTDLGDLVFHEPSVLDAILQFRETQEAIAFRREIRQMLATNDGHEFTAALNAGLKRNIPASMLEKARNQLAGLLTAQCSKYRPTEAVWNNASNMDSVLRVWRAQSLSILRAYCREKRIETYDLCPCKSSDQLRFCCERALRH
jgi:hypothetical protein